VKGRGWKVILVLCAFSLAAIIVLSDVLVMALAGEQFYPFHYFSPTIRTLDFTMYSAIVKHVSLHGWVTEPQVFELSKTIPSREWLPFLIAGALYSLVGNYWIIIMKFAGAVAIFLLSWLLFGLWVKGNGNRIAISALFTLFPNIFDLFSPWIPELLVNISKLLSSTYLFIDRFHSPIATLPFFLLAIYFTLKSFETKKAKDAVVAGFFAGLLVYVYFYYVAFFAGLFIVLLYEWNSKKAGAGNILKSLPLHSILIFATAAIVALPYLANLALNAFSGLSGDLVLRLGFGEVSRPYYTVPTLKYLALLAGAYFLIKKWDMQRVLLAGILLGSVVGMNLQVVFGVNLAVLHWQNQVADQMSLIFLVSLFALWKAGSLKVAFPKITVPDQIKNSAWAILLLAALFLGLVTQFHYTELRCAQSGCAAYTISPQQRQALEWLEENSSKEDVVLALSAQTNSRISADTGLYVFYPNGFLTSAKNGEIEKRVGFAYKFFGVRKDTINWLFTPQKDTLSIHSVTGPVASEQDLLLHEKALAANFPFHFLYHATGVWSEKKFEDQIASWPQDVQKEIRENGKEGNIFFYSHEAAMRIISIYENSDPQNPPARIDFVWVGEYEKLIGNNSLDSDPSLAKVFENPQVTIYKRG